MELERAKRFEKMHSNVFWQLPANWHVVSIGAIGAFSKGRGVRRDHASSGDIACVRYGELYTRHHNIIRTFGSRISESVAATSTRLRSGDILFAASGETKEDIGKCAAHVSLEPAYAGGDILILRPTNDHVPEFLGYLLNCPAVALQKWSKGQGDAVVHISASALASIEIAIPDKAEQRAIAEALSDTDALIEFLSLQLAKKRHIKQGAMQELLTGRKRLPGFSGGWATRPLNQLADIRSGGTPSTQTQFWNGNILWCTPTDITALNGRKYLSYTARRITSLGMYASSAELIPPGSVVMTSRATIGECAINTAAVTTNQGFKSFVPFENVDPEYLYYLLQANRAKFISLCSGSTFLEIGKAQLSAFEVVVPAEKDEQSAISRVLSEMDEGITTLEGKLTKATQLKQGMMQALLTGRMRLLQPASNVTPLPLRPAAAQPQPSQPAHNWQINEAVVIGVLSQRFGDDKFPLPRKRRVKLMYLLHRHAEGHAAGYLKKAAGPYDPNTKYKGPEAIALKNGYVRALHNGTYEGFVAGDEAEQAKHYFEQWYGTAALNWLERFHFRKTEQLELLATVDMAMVDLAAAGQTADVVGIKRVIAANPEWMPKLSRELFSDENIARAMTECATLFTA